MRTVLIVGAVALASGAAAECLTKEERQAATERYNHCLTQAEKDLSIGIGAWDFAGCNKIPQPMNCRSPWIQWREDKKQCLEEFKAGVLE